MARASNSKRQCSQNEVADVLEPLGVAYWTGCSGREFRYTVFSLVGCPAPRSAIWVAVRVQSDGRAKLLASGITKSEIPSVNLAAIRLKAARLGATEIHIAPLEQDDETSCRISTDIADAHALIEFACC